MKKVERFRSKFLIKLDVSVERASLILSLQYLVAFNEIRLRLDGIEIKISFYYLLFLPKRIEIQKGIITFPLSLEHNEQTAMGKNKQGCGGFPRLR